MSSPTIWAWEVIAVTEVTLFSWGVGGSLQTYLLATVFIPYVIFPVIQPSLLKHNFLPTCVLFNPSHHSPFCTKYLRLTFYKWARI